MPQRIDCGQMRTLAARRLAGGNAEDLGRQADRALHLQALVLGALDQVSADLLEVLHVAAGEGNTDAVHLGSDILLNSPTSPAAASTITAQTIERQRERSEKCRRCYRQQQARRPP